SRGAERCALRSSRPKSRTTNAQPAPARHTAFSSCLRLYRGQVRFHVTTSCSQLRGCHPRPVNGYKLEVYSRRESANARSPMGRQSRKTRRSVLAPLVTKGRGTPRLDSERRSEKRW